MSVLFSGSFSGTFVADGLDKFIALPSGVDFMKVENETVSYAAGAGTGAEFFWRRGMADGRGTIYTKTAVTGALAVSQIAAGAGFYLINTTINVPGASRVVTSINGANPPVVTAANTTGLVDGSTIVRIFNVAGGLQLGGIDFTVGVVNAGADFELKYMAPIVAAAGPGTYRIIPFNPYFYPSTRYITKIISNPLDATETIVTLSVTHSYTVGQVVRLKIPRVTALAFGMTELNDVQATIVAIGDPDADATTNTITIDVDSSGFTAFAWPLTADPLFTPAQVIPMGENTAKALSLGANILGDATENQAQFGMLLKAGTLSPAGAVDNVISWQAFKSFNQ